MAQNNLGNDLGVVDKRQATRAGSGSDSVTTNANFSDVAAMRTRLNAISATAYSATTLDKMTENDMTWALRQADEAAGI